MELRSAIVDECGCVRFWCDELQGEDQIECILNEYPEEYKENALKEFAEKLRDLL